MESTSNSTWVGALDLIGRTLWHLPASFRLAELMGPNYSLRCVLFHHIADIDSNFTKGLGVTTTRGDFEAALKFITKHYTPISLQDVLNEDVGYKLPRRPVLMTFDDAYASVSDIAAPLCKRYGVPAVFFINALCVGNERVALDNLVCYTVNIKGLEAVSKVASRFAGNVMFRSMKDVFNDFLPTISLSGRESFRDSLLALLGTPERELAEQAKLYLTKEQTRALASFNFEVGNHTYTHVNGRMLKSSDFNHEIDRNKSELRTLSGQTVNSFSVPYGSEKDLPEDLLLHLQRTGHSSAFLVESRANQVKPDLFRINRVSVKSASDAALFSEIEVLPRFRSLRNSLRDLRTNQKSASASLEAVV